MNDPLKETLAILKEILAFLKDIPISLYAFLLWPLAVFAVVIAIAFLIERFKIQKITSVLGGQVSLGNKGYGIWEGVPYEFSYRAGSKHKSDHIELRIQHVFPGEFNVSTENKVDKFFQGLRLSQELKVGDDAFDGKFYIETNAEEASKQYFSQQTKRAAVEKLFEAGVTQIEHTGKQLVISKYPFPRGGDEITEILRAAKELLENATYAAVGGGTGLFGLQALKKWFNDSAAALFFLGLCAFFFSGTWHVFNEAGLFFFSLRYSVPPLVCLWAAFVFFFKGRTFFHRLFFSVFFTSTVGGALLGFAAVKTLNAWLDHGSVTYRQALVLSCTREGKHNDIPVLHVQGWEPGRPTEKITVSSQVYSKTIPQRTVITLQTKPGKFGYEWLINYSISPANSSNTSKPGDQRQ